MSNTKQLHLGGTDLPIDIDALEALPSTGGVSTFDFTYRTIRFAARAEDLGDGAARLKLVGDIGPVPFTAEAPIARVGMAHIMMHANTLLGQRFRLVDSRLMFGADATLASPVTATNLVTAAAGLLIPAASYFELLTVYMEPGKGIRPEWRRNKRPAVQSTPRLALSGPAR